MSRPLRLLAVLAALAATPMVATAQNVWFSEDFDAGLPGTFTLTNNNGAASLGWHAESVLFTTPAVWHDAEPGIGQADNDMETPDFDLSSASAAYLHLESITRWANFQANHPSSIGNGVSALEVSSDGGATWTTGFWANTQTVSDLQEHVIVDLGVFAGAATTRLRFHYEGDFAHAWAIDDLRVDDNPLPPAPPPTVWDFVALPTVFQPASGFFEDFETANGVVQPYMAITEVDATTLLPDPESWCNIGQHAPNAGTAYSGSRFAELSRRPGTSIYTMSRNALVLGLNGGVGLNLAFRLYEAADETHEFDGVWVSEDGIDWYRLHDGHANTYAWLEVLGLPLDGTPADVSGDFYLMFAQQDNHPWATDGIGYDDIRVAPVAPPGPFVSVQGVCGVTGSRVAFSGGTPGGGAALVWGWAPGSFAIPGSAAGCVGTLLDIDQPTLLEVRSVDPNGDALFGPVGGIPVSACGNVVIQVLDISTCTPSNVLAL